MYFIDAPTFSMARTVYLDALLTEPALDGLYGNEIIYRNQIDGVLVDVLPCPEITILSLSDLEATRVTITGNVVSDGGDSSAIRGFCLSESPVPTIDDDVITYGLTGSGTYSLTVQDLTADTTYYVAAYTIIFGEILYSNILEFATTDFISYMFSITGRAAGATSCADMTYTNKLYSNTFTGMSGTLYTDSLLTTPFAGASLWYQWGEFEQSNQISNSGVVTNTFYCYE
jgi:hypothetical protein